MRRGLASPLPWLGFLLVAYLAFPVAAFAVRISHSADPGFGAAGLWPALGVSVEGATISLVLITLFGVPLAHALVSHRGRIANVVGVIVQLPLALPPLMSGILLIFVVGPYTTLGQFFGGRLTESLPGVVIAQSFVSAPFLVIAARSAFTTVDPTLDDLAATLGHRPLARFLRVDLRCAAGGIRAGMVLTWLRAFGEYGATVIVAYHPFSLPIYTDNQFEAYPLSTTEAPTLIALAAAAVVVAIGQARLPVRIRRRKLPVAQPPAQTAPTPVGFDLDTTIGTFHLQLAYPPAGSRLAIVGPSGSGKSVTLRALAGLLGPAAGPVTYGGIDVSAVAPERRRIGYVPQGLGLIPGLTVWQQVLFGVRADPARAAWWVGTLHLEGLTDRYPEELSGGQRQRVSLARALAGGPEIVFLDEPFSALDAPVRDELRREVRRLQHETGLSTVLVTHDPQEAAFLADEIVVIADGQLLQSGPVAEIYRRPASRQVARLLGISNVRPGVITPGGELLAGSVSLTVATGDQAGSQVLWSVLPEQVTVTAPVTQRQPPSSYAAVVTDVIDIGVALEVTVRLDGGPELRSRRTSALPFGPGDRCLVRLDPAEITVWAVPAIDAAPLL
jgi:molybdate transport system ATP-binding protein/molybdate transport system permease protein